MPVCDCERDAQAVMAGEANGDGRSERNYDSKWFKRAVEAAGHAIFITDVDGRIRYVNPAFSEISGYSPEYAIGRTPTILNSGHHSSDYFRRLWDTITRGDVWQEEVINRRNDGELYVANQTIAPISDPESGNIVNFVAIQTDITEQKQHETALERSRDLSSRTEETADVGGWELDLDAEELRWTAGTRQIHGVAMDYEPTLEEAIEFYHPEDRDEVQRHVEQALTWNIPYDVEARLITADDDVRVVRTTGERLESEGTTLLRGTIKDVTDEKTRRQQLMVFNRVLRHNLRNRINVVMGHAEQLRDGFTGRPDDGPGSERAREHLGKILSAGQELVDISERAREFDRVRQQIRSIDSIELEPLLNEVVDEYRDAFPEGSFEVVGEAPVVLSNYQGLRIALEELVENAAEHSNDATATVTLRVEETATGEIRISVEDNGPGIPEAERRVIETGAENPIEHGSGIGLWIVKWLMAPLGGTLSITENVPQGTVVSVEFPEKRWKVT